MLNRDEREIILKDYHNNHPIINCLLELRMSEREAKVYLALLNKRRATASVLQKTSGVPQNKIYDTLNSLTRKGHFSERQEGRLRIFEIVDPKVSLNHDFQKLNDRFENAIQQKKEIEKIYNSNEQVVEPFEFIEIVHGNENVHRKFIELLRNGESELLAFTRPPFASKTKDMKEEQKVAFYNYLKRGESRGVYEVHEDSLPRMFYNIHSGYKIGESLRIVPKLPLKMFIFDRKTLLIAEKESLTEDSEMTMTVVKQRATVNGYIALFDFFWEQGLTYEQWIKGKERLMEQKLAEFKVFLANQQS